MRIHGQMYFGVTLTFRLPDGAGSWMQAGAGTLARIPKAVPADISEDSGYPQADGHDRAGLRRNRRGMVRVVAVRQNAGTDR